MDNDGSASNVVAHMQLRAPRVALVVPATTDWHRVAMHGIHLVTTAWGGAGFVVVPAVDGGVHPAVLAALREYDPDSVLVPPRSVLTPKLADAVKRAQEMISAVCSNYRSPLLKPSEVAKPEFAELWNIWFSTDGLPSSGDPVANSSVSDAVDNETSIGANPALGGSLGLAAAARWGLSEAPSDADLEIDDSTKRAAVMRLSSHEHKATGLRGVNTE